MGLSGRMNNEARFQHIKGEGGDGGATLRSPRLHGKFMELASASGGGARFGGGLANSC